MFDGRYLDWNQKKIKGIIDFYGYKFFYLKKILDLGCGHGDIGGALFRLGADVTAVDARQEHLKVVQKKYQGIKVVRADLDYDWPFQNSKFDMVVDLDLICHLNDYESHIRKICKIAKNIIIETAVTDGSGDGQFILSSEDKQVYDLSVNGVSCRPTAAAIERVLLDCGFSFKRLDSAKFNSGNYVYDWQSQNTDKSSINNRRIWFASSVGFAKPANPEPVHTGYAPPPAKQYPALYQGAPSSVQTYLDIPNIKIGVCISGHVRLFEKSYQSFLANVMHPFKNFDVFMHTWETMGAAGGIASDDGIANKKTISKIEEISQIIKPTVIEIEDYGVYDTLLKNMESQARLTPEERAGFRSGHLLPYLSMLYSWKRSKMMLDKYEIENNVKYDVIIKLRLDEVFTRKININDYVMNFVYVPNVGQFYANAMNDQFAVGDSNSMKVYLELFDSLIEYLNAKEAYLLRPEVLLKHHLEKNNIKTIEVVIPYYLLRSNGTPWHMETYRR